MMKIQRCFLKFAEKRALCLLYRSISNIPTDNKNVKDTGKESKKEIVKNGKKETKGCATEKSQFLDTNDFLPDRKGDVQVSIIGGSDATIYTAALLKQSRLIKRVHLIDTKGSFAAAALDINHIDTSTRVKHYKRQHLKEALKHTNIIALMDETNVNTKNSNVASQFESTSMYVHEMAEQMARVSADSLVAVFARPVTATLPMVSEIYKLCGWWDPDRIIGSTALDRMRIEAITANLLDLNPAFLSIPMVGGADSNSVVPLLSRASSINGISNAQQEMLLQYMRNADKEISGTGSKGSYLSEGAAAAKFIITLASGLSGLENIVSSAYVRSNVLPVCRFFTSELQFGRAGVQKNFGLPKVSSTEIIRVEQSIPLINECIKMAEKAIQNNRHIKLKHA